jgi:hypothetical protein
LGNFGATVPVGLSGKTVAPGFFDGTAPYGELGEPMPVDLFGETAEGANSGGIVPEGISDEPVAAGVSEGPDLAACAKHSPSATRAFWQSKRSTAPFVGS